jgi:hypothetical protein
MTFDQNFTKRNRASTERIRELAARLTDEQLLHPVGEHWTVAVAFAHLAFWDLRALDLLDRTEREGHLSAPEIDVSVNDLSLQFWKALPPRQAVQLAIESAEALDKRLEGFAPGLLEEIHTVRDRWVERSLHRNEHLDEVEAALKS